MLKVAIAGCGLISTKKHIPAFMEMKDKVRIVAICDLNEEQVKKVAERFKIEKYYTDFDKMLIEEKPDLVDICTPPQTHTKLAVRAIESGAHLLLEKPMATDLAGCDSIIEAEKKSGKKVCIMHNKIFNPAIMKARAMVEKGGIGEFIGLDLVISTPTDYMTSSKDHWAHKLPGGVLGETGPHAVYLAGAFLKNVYDAKVCARKILKQYPWSNYEDFRINLFAENGLGSIRLIYAANQWAVAMDIIGTKATLKVDLEAQSVLRYERSSHSPLSMGFFLLSTAFNSSVTLISNSIRYILHKGTDAHHIGIRSFVNSIINNSPSPVSAQDGRETIRIMQLLVERLNQQG